LQLLCDDEVTDHARKSGRFEYPSGPWANLIPVCVSWFRAFGLCVLLETFARDPQGPWARSYTIGGFARLRGRAGL